MVSNGSEPPAPGPLPLIGLSTYVERASHGAWDEPSAIVPDSYVRAVVRAGGCPVLLPPPGAHAGVFADAVLAVLDGVVIIGGPDVAPERYGAEAHDQTDRPRPERDAYEVALCRGALALGTPLLAICRGLQVLNVSLGGTLHQHLPEVVGHDSHRVVLGQVAPNRVSLDPASAVGRILGPETEGLCHHHQAIDEMGAGLVATGFADDGTVEAAEVPGKAFAIGVQWHPEDNPDDDRLFVALVGAASHYRAGKSRAARGPEQAR